MNYAVCWTNMRWANTKGAGDDQSDELAFSNRDAFPGLDLAALPVARHGDSRTGRGSDDSLPPRLRPLCYGRGYARLDARGACGYVLLSYKLQHSGPCKVFSNPTGAGPGNEQYRFNTFIQSCAHVLLAGCSALAGGSMAIRSSVLQPSFRRRISVAGTGAPQTVRHRKRSSARDVSHVATPAGSRTNHPLLRVRMAASSGGD